MDNVKGGKTFGSSFIKTASGKYRILGNEENMGEGLLFLGNYLALDRSKGAPVFLDALKPHAVLICGKRGYGKSYTMGCLLEELALLPPDLAKNLASLVIDTMGIFWTIKNRNMLEAGKLKQWDLDPSGIEAEVFVPAGKAEGYEKRDISVTPFSISISELSGGQWCRIFNVDEVSPLGVLIVRVIESLRKSLRTRNEAYSFEDVIAEVHRDERSDPVSKGAAENYFRAVDSWGVFEKEGTRLSELVSSGKTSVLDVSTLENENVCAAVVSIIAGSLYAKRLEARRAYEKKLMEGRGEEEKEKEKEKGGKGKEGKGKEGNEEREEIEVEGEVEGEEEFPMVWLFIDEAHLFLPAGAETLASEVLINRCLRQGRQPGLSLILATQRPSGLHTDVVSQSDLLICHRLTASDDILALEAARPLYMQEGIRGYIKKMGSERGAALIVDDHSESIHLVRVRPRLSWHGGGEPSALMPADKADKREETATRGNRVATQRQYKDNTGAIQGQQ